MASMGLEIPRGRGVGVGQIVLGVGGLDSEVLGLKQQVLPPPSRYRKLEDWIASTIDRAASEQAAAPTIWNRLIEGSPGARRRTRSGVSLGDRSLPPVWPRFRVAYKQGITMVTLSDQNLVRSSWVEELGRDLMDLIDADNHRLVLDLSGVERVSSWVARIAVEASRKVAARPGGAFKICGVAAKRRGVFRLAGGGRIWFADDLAGALGSPWPPLPGPPALSVEILSALLESPGDSRPQTGVEPVGRPAGSPAGPPRVKAALLVHLGGRRPRRVAVTRDRYVVGRQQGCELRLSAASVSKRHAVFFERNGRFYLQDLASTNGTIVNGRMIRDDQTVLAAGDRVQVGPAAFVVELDESACEATRRPLGSPLIAEPDPAAVLEPSPPEQGGPTLTLPVNLPGSQGMWEHFVYDKVQDLLVITPRLPQLEEDAEIDALREALALRWELSPDPRAIINLENIDRMAPRAIGVILAHHLRLVDSGGSARICQARARIMTILHQLRLTMLVECYPTLDQAVLDAWPRGQPAACEA